jgi:hypothetical protein
MFKIKKKPLTSNTIWDAENNRPLCKFNKGIIQTEDKDLAEKLKALGYEVEGEESVEAAPENEEIAPVQPSEEATEEATKPHKRK